MLMSLALSAQDVATVNESTQTKIGGRIVNPGQSEVALTFFRDIVSFNEESFSVPIQQNNEFGMSFQLNEPTQVMFNYMGIELKLFLEPGDDLFIQFTATTTTPPLLQQTELQTSYARYAGNGDVS